MFSIKEGRTVFNDEFVNLIKQPETEQLLSILQNSYSLFVVDSNQTSLLHLAAKCNNAEFTRQLLLAGCNINSQDCSGTTPICMAAINQNFDVLKVLLDADADIFITDIKGSSLLKHLLSDDVIIPANIFDKFFGKLKNAVETESDKSVIAKYLTDADCPLEYGLLLKNSEVTKRMLEHSYFEILLNPCELLSAINDPLLDLTSIKSHIQQLATWDIVDQHFFKRLVTFLEQTSNDNAVRMLLDFGMLDHMRQTFKLTLLPRLFSNPHLDCVSLFQNREFDVNIQYEEGTTLLHKAIQQNNQKYVEFLLNLGANPNLKDTFGSTAMKYVKSVECMKLLLRYGADIQSFDNNGYTFFHYKAEVALLEEGLAHLSLLEDKGARILRIDWTDAEKLEKFYNECRRQIEWMKTSVVIEKFTVYDALCAHPRDTFYYVRSGSSAAGILNSCRDYNLIPQFLSNLEINLNDVIKIHDLKEIAASVISESIDLFAPDHLIIRTIVEYFNYDDLRIFL